ncbi:hypothetical protein J6590_081481 [Homalodisca vitripennis]|nr:hypothetical protein J6590_081481 [Homalodisca vitripennis]
MEEGGDKNCFSDEDRRCWSGSAVCGRAKRAALPPIIGSCAEPALLIGRRERGHSPARLVCSAEVHQLSHKFGLIEQEYQEIARSSVFRRSKEN